MKILPSIAGAALILTTLLPSVARGQVLVEYTDGDGTLRTLQGFGHRLIQRFTTPDDGEADYLESFTLLSSSLTGNTPAGFDTVHLLLDNDFPCDAFTHQPNSLPPGTLATSESYAGGTWTFSSGNRILQPDTQYYFMMNSAAPTLDVGTGPGLGSQGSCLYFMDQWVASEPSLNFRVNAGVVPVPEPNAIGLAAIAGVLALKRRRR